MKVVVIDDATGKPFTIADGTNSRVVGGITGPDGFELTATRETQTDKPVRAQSAVQTPRQNRRTEWAFGTSILQASVSAAQQFVLDYDSLVPLSGQVQITTDTDGGPAVRYINNATIDVVTSRYEGSTSFHKFKITGSMVTKSKA